jgi:putative nucleotidyltransferase with HDIG domain
VIGTTLLNYLVGDELGSGGLGTVYRGEHTIIGRKAALKVLKPSVSHDADLVARFLAEARAVNAIRHPNIVEVTDYGQVGNLFVIVMELLDGETLAKRLQDQGQLGERECIGLLVQLASAMGAAHEHGIVHRDLKPENIFLTEFADYPDFVKVLDFGIAKLSGELASTAQTIPGLIIGTPSYMSPEQCMGDPNLDARSDIYSLGVVAYRMATGQLPYSGATAMAMMHGHVSGLAAPIRVINGALSFEFEALVQRCMALAPAERFESMNELKAALTAIGARMPLAFSAEELGEPAPIRIVPASNDDHAQQHTWVRSAPKPVDSQEQRARVETVLVSAKLREIIAEKLRSNSLKLPALPEVAIGCLQLSNDPDVKFSSLAALIERDPFIASRVVRLGNSAMFGALPRLTTVEGAVARLGTRSLITLLQELAAEQVFISRDPAIRNAFRGIWEHCLGVAHLSRDLSRLVVGTNPNTAYLAGLFHDIGKPVVASLLLEHERGSKRGEFKVGSTLWLRVVEELYRDVGAILALRWFLPREVANAIAQADTYDLKRGRHSSANIVRLANALCGREGLDTSQSDLIDLERVIVQGRQVLGVDMEQLSLATAGLVERVHALTEQQDENNATRVFERGAL